MSFKLLCLILTLLCLNFVKCKPSEGSTSLFGGKGDCEVIEVASNSKKPCKFPFIFKNQTFYGCTKVAAGDNGKAWCSTKIDPLTNEHIRGQKLWGDCLNDCPTDEEAKKDYNDVIEKTTSK